MLKIILAINPAAPSRSAFGFAAYLARVTGSAITGVLLENKESMVAQNKTIAEPNGDPVESVVLQSASWFRDCAVKQDVNAKLHRDRGMPYDELIRESRYADMMIVHPAISFTAKAETSFTAMARRILKRSECPVFAVTRPIDKVTEIVVAYDGSASSVFALKMFKYMFPMLGDCALTILHTATNKSHADPGLYKFREWLRSHHDGPVTFTGFAGSATRQLPAYCRDKENTIIITGAYKRSAWFRFRETHVEWLVRNTGLPVFVTHR